MTLSERQPRLPPELKEASLRATITHYIECLNLPQASQVLIVTDRVPQDISLGEIDSNLAIRVSMSEMMAGHLTSAGHQVRVVAFNHLMNKEEMSETTKRALSGLEKSGGSLAGRTTTIVYLGDVWANRGGFYGAIKEFAKAEEEREVKLAGSLGLTTGDCRVLSQLTAERRSAIEKANEFLEKFFKEHPKGQLKITTSDKEGNNHCLRIDYDLTQTPLETDLGFFTEGRAVKLWDCVAYINIPGGEKCFPPLPFKNSNGEFVSEEGICFLVENGLVVRATAEEGALEKVDDPSQRQLLQILSKGGQIPLSELGLGFYKLAEIAVFSDCSTLSREKTGPHAGLGHDPTEMSPEAKEIEQLSGDFYHTDFVMNNPRIEYANPETNQAISFYPPSG